MGDWGLGLASVAEGLGFLPPMQALWAFARTPAFARHAARPGGDDIAPTGQVRWTV